MTKRRCASASGNRGSVSCTLKAHPAPPSGICGTGTATVCCTISSWMRFQLEVPVPQFHEQTAQHEYDGGSMNVILAMVHIYRLQLEDDFYSCPTCRHIVRIIGYGGLCEERWVIVRFAEVIWHGKLGFGMECRVSMMLATVAGVARGLSGRDLRRLLGLRIYALSFRREALSVLDVAFVAVECFSATTSVCRRRCLTRRTACENFPRTCFGC